MPMAAKKNDPLSLLGDGVVGKSSGRSWPIPLAATKVDVEIVGGLAVVRTERRFRNAEDKPIEATMTFPVPVDAALTGLRAEIDGRALVAEAKPSKAARDTYEAAIDSGKTAILHEEKLRGVHMLSLGNLAPGKEASVTVTFVSALTFAGDVPTLRIPTSVGEIFGRSTLLPSDEMITGDVVLKAQVRVSGDGAPLLLGSGTAEAELALDGAIVVAVPAFTAKDAHGRSADGAPVSVAVDRLGGGDASLDLTVVFDRSGSTNDPIATDGGTVTAWATMSRGLRQALGRELRPGDRVRILDYGSDVHYVGQAHGADAVRLVDGIRAAGGGTETGLAVAKAMAEGTGDILLLTDGRSRAIDVGRVAAMGRRVTSVLVGTGALDAYVGHLAALTGGQIFVVPADQADSAILGALASLRLPSRNPAGERGDALPREHRALRGGAGIAVTWGDATSGQSSDDIGRYAAALALPLLTDEAATRVAIEHGLCTHLTSLVMVDEAGEAQAGIPATRKIPMMEPQGLLASAAGGGVKSLFRSASPSVYGSSGGSPEALTRSFASATRGGGDETWASYAGEERAMLGSRGDILERRKGGDLGKPSRPGATRRLPDFGDGFLGGPPAPPPSPAPAKPFDLPGASAVAFDLAAEAARVDWDTVAAAADAAGLDALPRGTRLVVLRAASLPAVAALAAAMGKDANLVALGLLASAAAGSRPAARLSRRLLAGATEPALAQARGAVGL